MNKADMIIEQLTSEQEAIEAINKIALAFCIDVDIYEEV
jgi:hypothetical protein